MPKGYGRKEAAKKVADTARKSNFSSTVSEIKSTTTGRERGQAIAAAAKAKKKVDRKAASRKLIQSMNTPKRKAAIKKMAANRRKA